MTQAIAKTQRDPTPEVLIKAAIEKGVDAQTIASLMEMRNTLKAEQAREAFYDSLSAFQAELPPIPKTRIIKDKYGNVRSRYASLDDIRQAVAPLLAKHGLSYRYEFTPQEGQMLISCIVTHKAGHAESSSIPMPVDKGMNASAQQQVGATMTYGQRYTLIGGLGITSADQDTDGTTITFIDDRKVVNIMRLIDESGADYEKFLTSFNIPRVADLTVDDCGKAIKALNRKIDEKKAEKPPKT